MTEHQASERRRTASEPPTGWRWWLGTAGWDALCLGIGLTPAFWLGGLLSVTVGGTVAPALGLAVVWAAAGWITGRFAGVKGWRRLLPAAAGFGVGVAMLLGGAGGLFHPLYLVAVWAAVVAGAWVGRMAIR